MITHVVLDKGFHVDLQQLFHKVVLSVERSDVEQGVPVLVLDIEVKVFLEDVCHERRRPLDPVRPSTQLGAGDGALGQRGQKFVHLTVLGMLEQLFLQLVALWETDIQSKKKNFFEVHERRLYTEKDDIFTRPRRRRPRHASRTASPAKGGFSVQNGGRKKKRTFVIVSN